MCRYHIFAIRHHTRDAPKANSSTYSHTPPGHSIHQAYNCFSSVHSSYKIICPRTPHPHTFHQASLHTCNPEIANPTLPPNVTSLIGFRGLGWPEPPSPCWISWKVWWSVARVFLPCPWLHVIWVIWPACWLFWLCTCTSHELPTPIKLHNKCRVVQLSNTCALCHWQHSCNQKHDFWLLCCIPTKQR